MLQVLGSHTLDGHGADQTTSTRDNQNLADVPTGGHTPIAESELSKFYNSNAMLAKAALYEQERRYEDEIYPVHRLQ